LALKFFHGSSNPVQKNLSAVMREALRIRDRFVAEPLFAQTGRGCLKSKGVSTRQRIKSNLRRHRPKGNETAMAEGLAVENRGVGRMD
jgi:hypothetical protein